MKIRGGQHVGVHGQPADMVDDKVAVQVANMVVDQVADMVVDMMELMVLCIGKGRERQSQAGPKGHQLEVGFCVNAMLAYSPPPGVPIMVGYTAPLCKRNSPSRFAPDNIRRLVLSSRHWEACFGILSSDETIMTKKG